MTDKLAIIVKESGLETTKAQVLLDNFSDYFQIASEWEKKAKVIVVTDVSQTAEMQMARAGRLFLREKRIHIERTRKGLKEQALREGRAIDGIANILKSLIVPIEDYLEEQEKFVEIRAAHEAELARIEAEKKAEREERARIQAEQEEQARILAENERLRIAAEKQERRLKAEKRKRETERRLAEAERVALEDRANREKEEVERKARMATEKQEKILEAEREAANEKIRAERREREAERQQAEAARKKTEARMQKERAARESYQLAAEKRQKEIEAKLAATVTCPFCHKQFVPTKVKVDHAGAN